MSAGSQSWKSTGIPGASFGFCCALLRVFDTDPWPNPHLAMQTLRWAFGWTVLSWVRLFAALWTAARQAPLSMRFSSKNIGVGCHFLLQEIFLTQGWNPHLLCLLHCRQILYPLSHWESPGCSCNRVYISYIQSIPRCNLSTLNKWCALMMTIFAY